MNGERRSLFDEATLPAPHSQRPNSMVLAGRRSRISKRSEQLHGEQRSLLEETLDAELEAMQTELDDLQLQRLLRLHRLELGVQRLLK